MNEAAPGPTLAPTVPAASVIVPTHARPERLAQLLESLAAQSVPADRVELVVVDDGSPDDVRPGADGLPANARLVRQRRQGPAAARNAGAALARGNLIAFIDDDCVAEPRWLEALLRAHAARPLDLLGGTTRNGLPENLLSDVAESLLGFFDDDETRAGRPLSFVASNNIACGREAFDAMGGFDTSYPLAAGEDRAFCRSWRARIGPLSRVPDARVLHFHAHDVRSFWRQQRNYGRGAALYHASAASAPKDEPATRPARRTFGLPREPAFYGRLLTHYGAGSRRPGRRLLALPALLLSQLAVASGLLHERRARR